MEKPKMYSAAIAQGNMYVSEIDNNCHEADVIDIYETVRAGHPVIIGQDFQQLEVMAGQLGLAFVPESV